MCGAASEHVRRYGGAHRKSDSTRARSASAEVAASSCSASHAKPCAAHTAVHGSPGAPRKDHVRAALGAGTSSSRTKSPPERPGLGSSVALKPEEGTLGQ